MNNVLDACSIINLINGGVLHRIALIPGYKIYIGDHLLEQEILNPAQKIIVESLILNGKLILLESDITLSEFTSLKIKYNLGDGETECIALCKKHDFNIVSDDSKARKSSIKELGTQRVYGSLFILRESVRANLLSCEEAKKVFAMMKIKGGFLPDINDDYFCE